MPSNMNAPIVAFHISRKKKIIKNGNGNEEAQNDNYKSPIP